MVDPALSAPVADVVNPHVHVEAAPFTSDEGAVPVTVTALVPVVVMVTPDEGDIAVVSADVARAKLEPPYAPAGPFTTATLKVAAVELPSALEVEHVCPLALENVITTTLVFDASEPVPTQLAAKFPLPVGVTNTMVGDVLEVVKPAGKVTVIVLLDLSRPDDDVVKPTVHVDAVLATREVGAVPVNVTAASDDALALTTFVSAVMSNVVSAAAITA